MPLNTGRDERHASKVDSCQVVKISHAGLARSKITPLFEPVWLERWTAV